MRIPIQIKNQDSFGVSRADSNSQKNEVLMTGEVPEARPSDHPRMESNGQANVARALKAEEGAKTGDSRYQSTSEKTPQEAVVPAQL